MVDFSTATVLSAPQDDSELLGSRASVDGTFTALQIRDYIETWLKARTVDSAPATADYLWFHDASANTIDRCLVSDFIVAIGGVTASLSKRAPTILAAGNVVYPDTHGNANSSGVAYLSDTMYLFPFTSSGIYDAIQMNTGAAAVIGNHIGAIYKGDGEYAAGLGGNIPGTKLWDASAVNVPSTTEAVINMALGGDRDFGAQVGTLWIALNFDVAANLRPAVSSTGLTAPNMAGASTKSSAVNSGLTTPHVYSGTMPADLTGYTFTMYNTGSPPACPLRAA